MSTARTWKCPQCGFSLEVSYDWLAEHGGPVCEHCDCDMDLRPVDTHNEKLAAELLEIGRELLDKPAKAHEQADGPPIAAASEQQIERLVDKADAAGLEPEDLDEIVHDLAASIAADVNNGGLDEQIRYLVDGMGVQQTERQLDDLIEDQPREGE